jgi:uncharacterized RDD family membrane protein YckC
MTSAVPLSPVPREARAHQGHRAGLVTRLAAGVLDALLVLLLLVLGYVAVNAVAFLVRPSSFHLLTAARPVVIAVALVGAVAYLSGTWWVAGRTWGCHVMGLRVVDRRGRSPRFVVAVVRAVLYVLFPVGVLWCAATASRRSLQDLLLGTTVIYDWVRT